MDVELHEIEAAVLAAGAHVVEGSRTISAVDGTPEGTLHPTTGLDRSTDELLFRILMEGREPGEGVAWLTEERADDRMRLGAETVFIVDPIDGTRSLLKGLHEAAVSVGLWRDGDLVMGCVYNPFVGGMYSAERGCGARLNGMPIAVSDARDIASVPLVMSRTEHERGLLGAVEAAAGYVPMGSIAYKMALVAEGRHIGTFTPHPRHEWDVAGAAILVEEAGGRVTDARGNPVRFNGRDLELDGIVVSNGRVHDCLLELVNEVL